MKISFVAGTLGQGGAEKQLVLLAKKLSFSGHEVVIFSFENNEFWHERLVEMSIKVIAIDSPSRPLSRLIWLFFNIRKFSPDVIYSFHFYTSLYAALVGRLTGVFSIGSIRSNGHSEKKNNGLFSYLCYHLPHAIIANSQHGLDNANSIFLWKRKKVAILNNAIENISKVPRCAGDDSVLKILFIGTLDKRKRPILFLQVLKELKYTYGRNFEAVMLGDGVNRPQVESFCREMNLDKNVKVIGRVNNVHEWMAKNDVLLSTSAHEGTPNVVLESMMMKLPVIAFDFQGIKAILGNKGERGFVIHSISECSAMLSEFRRLDSKSACEEAFKYVNQNYSEQVLVERFFNILNAFNVR